VSSAQRWKGFTRPDSTQVRSRRFAASASSSGVAVPRREDRVGLVEHCALHDGKDDTTLARDDEFMRLRAVRRGQRARTGRRERSRARGVRCRHRSLRTHPGEWNRPAPRRTPQLRVGLQLEVVHEFERSQDGCEIVPLDVLELFEERAPVRGVVEPVLPRASNVFHHFARSISPKRATTSLSFRRREQPPQHLRKTE
jgi:hypothetical protein